MRGSGRTTSSLAGRPHSVQLTCYGMRSVMWVEMVSLLLPEWMTNCNLRMTRLVKLSGYAKYMKQSSYLLG